MVFSTFLKNLHDINHRRQKKPKTSRKRYAQCNIPMLDLSVHQASNFPQTPRLVLHLMFSKTFAKFFAILVIFLCVSVRHVRRTQNLTAPSSSRPPCYYRKVQTKNPSHLPFTTQTSRCAKKKRRDPIDTSSRYSKIFNFSWRLTSLSADTIRA